MNRILNLGFLAIFLPFGARYYINDSHGLNVFDIFHLSNWEMWAYGACIIWFILAFWNTVVRRRCPSCGSHKLSPQGSREIDRWVSSKRVKERVGDNSYGYRSVTVTFEKIEHLFKCLLCGNSWSEIEKREKN